MSEPAVWIDDAGYQNLRVVADRLLETTRVEYVDEGVLLVMNPPGIEHRRIVRAIVDDAKRAFYTGAITVNWAADENYQWDLPDGSGRFYVPEHRLHPSRRDHSRTGEDRDCPRCRGDVADFTGHGPE